MNRINAFQSLRARANWRDYQTSLKRSHAQKKIFRSFIKFSPTLPLLLFAIYGIFSWISNSSCSYKQIQERITQNPSPQILSKREVRSIIDENALINLNKRHFDFKLDGLNYGVDTSINIPLQQLILKKMDRSTSRYIGFVAMEPSTGQIIAMASYDKIDKNNNPCIDNSFPAASIFKIITAAAAVEKCGFSPTSKLTYNGRKYTLYKSQLKNKKNKYTNKISFKNSFAQSVNPVFGKIGANYLGKTTLEKYATAFGFNQNIDFEIPLPPSLVSLTDESYQWAEVACGFNKQTVLTPVHGAILSSAILNQGKIIEPTIIEKIVDETGNAIYQSQPKTLNTAISPNTSKVVEKLMLTTITSGTCRKAFRGRKRDRILKNLDIGGKTGSINNKTNDVRYDWFVGFAQEKDGPGQIAISVIVAHEKYIGKRASYYAKIGFKEYFRNYFARNKS